MKKNAILVIHGGDSYGTDKKYLADLKRQRIDIRDHTGPRERKWKETLGDKLGPRFQVIYPEMPTSRWNDKYGEWKIWFEKFIPYLSDGSALIGHSLGGIFLAKYLSENKMPKRLRAVILVAPPYEDSAKKGKSLHDFNLPKDMSLLERQAGELVIYHSKDDPVVTFSDTKRYLKKLPAARIVALKDKGHFSGRAFPELVKKLKDLYA